MSGLARSEITEPTPFVGLTQYPGAVERQLFCSWCCNNAADSCERVLIIHTLCCKIFYNNPRNHRNLISSHCSAEESSNN